MHKRAFIALGVIFLILFFSFSAYAFDTALLDMRNKIFEQSKEIKSLIVNSKDVVLINNMWDSCIMTMTQIDAYFYMIGIFNTIKKEELSDASVNYLISWLNEIKKTNELNIISLNTATQINEVNTRVYVVKLKNYFGELNNKIDAELNKVNLLKRSLTTK